MKFLIVFAALFAVAAAGTSRLQSPQEAVILKQASDIEPSSFAYNWETSDGQAAQAAGQLKNIGTEQEALAVKGSFSFVGDDGQTYTVNYIADENGFQPQAAHLPVAPVT
ncbi:larval cuticle protein 65Ag1-like [Drosophila takahashii]|uniref:larval cuticle protein 65Ag1-like n=1 Tax=Drosophila takahashii TaxID=29030 RepID=UPI001CF8AD1B|nr:larval cuticle protein 65Ag1-like [Drosophila takahashii]